MATSQEVRDACIKDDDNTDLQNALDTLALIFGGTGSIEMYVRRDGEVFNLGRLLAVLEADNAAQDTMVSDIETAVLGAIGATDQTAGTIRKAIADLKASHEADIAAT